MWTYRCIPLGNSEREPAHSSILRLGPMAAASTPYVASPTLTIVALLPVIQRFSAPCEVLHDMPLLQGGHISGQRYLFIINYMG